MLSLHPLMRTHTKLQTHKWFHTESYKNVQYMYTKDTLIQHTNACMIQYAFRSAVLMFTYL